MDYLRKLKKMNETDKFVARSNEKSTTLEAIKILEHYREHNDVQSLIN